MTKCPFIDDCALFRGEIPSRDIPREIIKNAYCRADYLSCGRHMVRAARGKEAVPRWLMPEDNTIALSLLDPVPGTK